MSEPEITREEAERIASTSVDWGTVVQNRLARTVVALYDREAAMQECIERLHSGWRPHEGRWVYPGTTPLSDRREPMTEAQRAVMEAVSQ